MRGEHARIEHEVHARLGDLLTAAGRFYEECDAPLLAKLPVTPERLDRAGYIATRLLEGAGTKTATPAEMAEAELVQLQSFTRFMEAYDELRAVIKLPQGGRRRSDRALDVRGARRGQAQG